MSFLPRPGRKCQRIRDGDNYVETLILNEKKIMTNLLKSGFVGRHDFTREIIFSSSKCLRIFFLIARKTKAKTSLPLSGSPILSLPWMREGRRGNS